MIETGVFPKIAQENKLGGFKHHSYWIDTGTPETYSDANKYFQQKEESKSYSPPFNLGEKRINEGNLKLGPNVSIATNCNIKGTDILDSIKKIQSYVEDMEFDDFQKDGKKLMLLFAILL